MDCNLLSDTLDPDSLESSFSFLSALSFSGDSNDHAEPQACKKEMEDVRMQLNALRKEYVCIDPEASFLWILTNDRIQSLIQY